MRENNYFIILYIIAVFLLAVVIIGLILRYYSNRQKKLLNRIQDMIASATDGSLEQINFDESKLSLIENSMWRFLGDNRLSSSKLAKQKEQIQTLISDISHQTVTPIANITLYSELLEERILKASNDYDNGIKDEIIAIREETDKLDFLMQSLIKLSRLENGIITVNVSKNHIQNVLSAIENQMKVKAKQKQIELIVCQSEEKALFDTKWTVEAILNIVDNAIKYTPTCGKVSISVEAYQIFLRINIHDNGIGIAEEEHSRIFSRFYRSAAVSDTPGVGIGLYLAREVISAQKGYIKVKSKLGCGTTFSIFLLR